jgi:SnoaL-like domain
MNEETRGGRSTDSELEDFVDRCLEGLSHQVAGNSEPFLAVWSRSDDVAILGAVGTHAQGWSDVRTHLLGAARSLNWTNLSVERLLTEASEGLAVTVVLEHMARETEEPTTRTLRTTQAYRREPEGWRLFLRHANPITEEDEARERALLNRDPA